MKLNLPKAQPELTRIDALVANESIVRKDWLYCHAIGGLRLMVKPEDAEPARASWRTRFLTKRDSLDGRVDSRVRRKWVGRDGAAIFTPASCAACLCELCR